MTDKYYLQRCIQLAKKAIGQTYPNPMVGAVIVHNDRIIGEGYHKKAGQPHAEINAINNISKEDQKLISEATIYVSLEPCAHFGKTPPCALRIKELNFKEVVIGITDSHDKVSGRGITIIKEAKIDVKTNILEKESLAINKRFFTFHQKKRPYIILKWAESADGFIDKDYKPYQISNLLCKQFVHKIRSEEHAILIGKNTALHDNPTLTVREVEGSNPIRILVDFNLDVPTNFNIYNKQASTLIFNNKKEGDEDHIKFIKIEKNNWIAQLTSHLHTLDIQSVLVEGGSQTLQQFIDAEIWDEIFVIQNPNLDLISGTKVPTLHNTNFTKTTLRDNIIKHYINPKNEFLK